MTDKPGGCPVYPLNVAVNLCFCAHIPFYLCGGIIRVE